MTKNDILSILSIIPKTGYSEFDMHIAKAASVLADSKSVPEHIQSQPETDILNNCIALMQDVADNCADWYETIKGDGTFEALEDKEDYPCSYHISYDELIERLFLANTNHCRQPFIRQKCYELNIQDDRLCIHASAATDTDINTNVTTKGDNFEI